MIHENAEIVRRAVAAFNARDLDALVELCDPAFEFRPYAMSPVSSESYRPDDMERYYRDLDEIWEKLTLEPVAFRSEGEVVVMTADLVARGRGSGVELDQPIFVEVEMRGDRLASMRYRE